MNATKYLKALWLCMLLTGAAAKAQTDFPSCLSSLRAPAKAAGVREDSFARFTQGLTPDMGILDKMSNQPEFKMPIWDYLAALVDEERVAEGLAQLARHKDVLGKVAAQYGVDAATVVARAKAHGVMVSAFAARTVRATTHLDVDRDACLKAGEVLASVMQG